MYYSTFSRTTVMSLTLLGSFASFCLAAAEAPAKDSHSLAVTNSPPVATKVSREQITIAINRGLDFLLKSQNSNGWWSTSEQPAVTALVLTAFNQEPSGRYLHTRPSELNRAYDFVLTSAQPDGSIHRGKLF